MVAFGINSFSKPMDIQLDNCFNALEASLPLATRNKTKVFDSKVPMLLVLSYIVKVCLTLLGETSKYSLVSEISVGKTVWPF